MSIIEQIKNGAKFRHTSHGNPLDFHFMKNGRLAVVWDKEPNDVMSYSLQSAEVFIELIPEEETLWVALPKEAGGSLMSEQSAIDHGNHVHGPGNYTIHSITRKK